MIFLGVLLTSLAVVNAQVRPIDPRTKPDWNVGRPVNSPTSPKSNTVIENRNVNIIVNVDPKDVAKELWKLIQGRLDVRQGRRSDESRQTINDLEKIITPIVTPTRRSHQPTAFEVAYELDHLTRKALLSDHAHPTIDDEIVTRDVVARMMVKLKSITETEEPPIHKSDDSAPAFRRMQGSVQNQNEDNGSKYNDDDDDDEYISVNLRIRKKELLRRSGTLPDVDS